MMYEAAMADKPDPHENKTERVHLLMSPSEVKAIDDWGFSNRIRTRAEAVRRLCHIGLALDKQSTALMPRLEELFEKQLKVSRELRAHVHRHEGYTSLTEAISEQAQLLRSISANILFVLSSAELLKVEKSEALNTVMEQVNELMGDWVGLLEHSQDEGGSTSSRQNAYEEAKPDRPSAAGDQTVIGSEYPRPAAKGMSEGSNVLQLTNPKYSRDRRAELKAG
jgi:hypothetical protein